MLINWMTHPLLAYARHLVEKDNGGHLIGTVYPGEKIDFLQFTVPPGRWKAEDLWSAELALRWFLLTQGEEEFYDFCNGDQTEIDEVIKELSPPDNASLALAHKFLDDYFNGWSDADGTE
jgi:hypothetical protein